MDRHTGAAVGNREGSLDGFSITERSEGLMGVVFNIGGGEGLMSFTNEM